MEKKFSAVINEQGGSYVVLLNCWTIVDGQRVTIAEAVHSCVDFPAAQAKATEFYTQHNI
jgi:hypothetical protein